MCGHSKLEHVTYTLKEKTIPWVEIVSPLYCTNTLKERGGDGLHLHSSTSSLLLDMKMALGAITIKVNPQH